MYTASFLVLRSAREYIDSDLPAALIAILILVTDNEEFEF